MSSRPRCIGILTSGGDCPGLNAAIRGVAKACLAEGIKVIGIQDGFRGLVENRFVVLDDRAVSGILTLGGTILGTSRDKIHKMEMGGRVLDMTQAAADNARRMQMDCLVCLGGAGTQKNAFRLLKAGMPVVTLPKTIDNDVALTDTTFGFDTALSIATEAIDRLHTTATSHHRIIVCEVMGHNAGWLALGSGIAGGADVILIPEIPYNPASVAEHLLERQRAGKRFSIIAVAEGCLSREEAKAAAVAEKEKEKRRKAGKSGSAVKDTAAETASSSSQPTETVTIRQGDTSLEMTYHLVQEPKASRLARTIQRLTGIEARVTTLGHVQRGGTPSAADRLLCTKLGTRAAECLLSATYGVMIAVRGGECVPVALEKVAGNIKTVPPDHDWVRAARQVGTCLGD